MLELETVRSTVKAINKMAAQKDKKCGIIDIRAVGQMSNRSSLLDTELSVKVEVQGLQQQ